MTNYSPLVDALESNDRAITASDMVDEGYTDFEQGEHVAQVRVAAVLDALDGQIFDDPAKWRIVNELVALLLELDDSSGVETHISRDGEYGLSFTFEPQAGESR